MKLGITAKLFLAILAACVAVLLINGIAVQAFVKRQFLDYLNEQGVERMQETLPRVRAEYARRGNWEFVRDNPDAWFVLMRPERGPGPPREAPPISDQTGAVFRFALLDQDYTPVIGNPDVGRHDILRPVVVGGRTVGWMAMLPFQKALAAADARFYAAQQRAWWAIGGACLLVAAVLGWLLSRTLLRRLRGLTHATHLLAAGDYATRIDAAARDELGQLARDFNLLAQALEHNERARRDFMADISHELRTPLAVLRAELEALQDGIRPMTPNSLGSLHQQVGQLGKLIEDLYDVSLTDVGALAYRRAPVDLAVILATVLDGLRARFAAAQLQVQAQVDAGPLQVDGDERRLQQLLGNLLENTLRYTDAGGTVQVRCVRRGAVLELVVEDSAPGVDADKRARLFERFYRTEASRNRTSGGSGLGLAICRNIAEAHGGSIHAEASALGGLRMVLHLPGLVA
ncbi:sensor histidine kinase efflux regulator BaeS [Xanthomonas campestris pv. merremiae]|uniref:sensor histidine kinase efflux regulator BaeS n=1 Tax=Xanthomonas citri TaxID=346 RepID=UPI000B5C1DB5|nr:sensor histidine kinase efflux regulator BaeS [Xanthomonas citri]ASK95168.1 two-component sensor histidine kinase [Xanthomonas citri pv. vignicola]MBV6836885.1 sensor histidine kinase efflux regulator BaeS [Xanthomonas campestris pv. merremiae]MBZ3931081.1 histidine kinase [Xanthomonas campestris pv. merremiae]MCC8566542.1 sensor histidine kinase efflux regulator BaeS [Xanthomonas citri pv. fuscans]